MSGTCVGWVLRHGPRDKAQRAVLTVLAEEADRNGRHAHPGIAAIVTRSLYSRSRVHDILAQLEVDGWLEVEAKGGGRGHATSYRVRTETVRSEPDPSQPETVRPRQDPSSEETVRSDPVKGPIRTTKRSDLGSETVRRPPRRPARLFPLPEVPPEEPPVTPPLAAEAAEANRIKTAAHELTKLAFEQNPKPLTHGGFVAVQARLGDALRSGHNPNALRAAIEAGAIQVWTNNGIATALAQRRRRDTPDPQAELRALRTQPGRLNQ